MNSTKTLQQKTSTSSRSIEFDRAVNDKWQMLLKKAMHIGRLIAHEGLRADIAFNEHGVRVTRYEPECSCEIIHRFRYEILLGRHEYLLPDARQELDETFKADFTRMLDFQEHLKGLLK